MPLGINATRICIYHITRNSFFVTYIVNLNSDGDVHGRGVGVVRALGLVHMVVRMDWNLKCSVNSGKQQIRINKTNAFCHDYILHCVTLGSRNEFKWSSFEGSGYNYYSGPNHLKTRLFKILTFLFRFQMVFDKMVAICLHLECLRLQISDPIQNLNHLQTNP